MRPATGRKYDVVGLGTSTLDRLYLVPAFPEDDGVHVPLDHREMGGGPTATAICTIAALGGKTAMIDRIGHHPHPEIILSGYQKHGVDANAVTVTESGITGHSSILVRQSDGARAITYLPGTTRELEAHEIDPALVQDASILHMNGRHLGAAKEAIAIAKKSGTLVSFDGGAGRHRPETTPIQQQADILIVARQYGEAATGQKTPADMLTSLAAHGAHIVGVTDGKHGSWILDAQAGQTFHQPAHTPAAVVDTTGCGDTYHGTFLYHLCRGASLRTCAQEASRLAALNCEGLGGRHALHHL